MKIGLFILPIILIPLISLDLYTAKKCYEECSPNEAFVECKASCQPYCGSTFNNSNLDCGCIHGCICKENMIRSSKTGKCISIDRCNKILEEQRNSSFACDENEHFSETKAGCQLSCYSYFHGARNESCHSEKSNSTGCVCNENYVRDTKTGKCIEISKCSKCRTNEEWFSCENCTTPACKFSCGSCKCKKGYINYNNHCISNCAVHECEANEEFLKCSNCENCCFNNPRTTCDKEGCYEGCFCKQPYVRNPLNDTCVLYENCPPRCHKYEAYGCQSRECEATCQNFNEDCETLKFECKFGCYCKQTDGYVRHKNGSCIHYTECFK